MKTTTKHFDYFRERCEYYRRELGLMDWDVSYQHTDVDPYARCQTKAQSCVATIILSTGDWKDKGSIPLNRYELDIVAWHEIIHLRLADLSFLAEARFTSVDEIDKAIESVTVALENFHRSHY